jgi:hypothetical protein
MFSYNIKNSKTNETAQQLLTNKTNIAMDHIMVMQRLQAHSGVVELEPAISCDAQDMVGHEHSLRTS